MLLHEPVTKSYRDVWTGFRRRRRTLIVAGALLLWSGALVVTAVVTRPATWAHEWTADHGLINPGNAQVARELLTYPLTWATTRNSPAVPVLTLDIKFKHILTLRAQRQAAIDRGVLLHGDDDFVPASIRFAGLTLPADVRLKGDLVDHLRGDKWAFRVKLEGNGRLFGLRRFSIMHPKGRDYHGEPLFFDAARGEGILTPRHFYVDVVLNGEQLGRMAIEEHFTKELLESQQRREGVMVRFDEAPFWESGNPFHLDTYVNAAVRPFQDSLVARSDILSAQLRIATGLMRAFVDGDLSASDVFDPKLMGRYLALADTWGAQHALRWNNMRFYFNPVTALLEPIAYDAMVGHALAAPQMYGGRYPFVVAALEDPVVHAYYQATLTRWSAADSEAVVRLAETEQRYRSILRRAYPLVQAFDLNALPRRATEMLAADTDGPVWTARTTIVQSYAIEEDGQHYVELASMVPDPVEVTDLYWRVSGDTQTTPLERIGGASLPLVLDGTPIGEVPRTIRLLYLPPLQPATLWIDVRPHGTSGVRSVPATPYFPALARSPLAARSLDAILGRNPFMRWDPETSTLSIPTGNWRIAEPLVLPEGVRVVVSAGTTLRVASDAAIIVRGPLHLRGTPGRPVRLLGMTNGPEIGPWPGIAVMRADERSQWTHVEVTGTAGIDLNGWTLTSGVTFYESDVEINEASFVGNRTEDVLNIVRSSFTLSNVNFVDAVSDGLDADFSNGTVSGGSFDVIGWIGGGDAIDVSGATVTVENVLFTEIGDKAISVGEGGSVVVRDVTIRDASAGIVSKDASRVEITTSRFQNVELAALMAYIKKPEYGPATLVADSVEFENVERPAWVQTGSSIFVNGLAIPAVGVNVDSLYDTAMRKSRTAR